MESSYVALVSLLVTLNIVKRIYAFFSSFNPKQIYIQRRLQEINELSLQERQKNGAVLSPSDVFINFQHDISTFRISVYCSW